MKHKQSTGFCLWNMNISILNIHIDARNRYNYLTISSSILFLAVFSLWGALTMLPVKQIPALPPSLFFSSY